MRHILGFREFMLDEPWKDCHGALAVSKAESEQLANTQFEFVFTLTACLLIPTTKLTITILFDALCGSVYISHKY